MNIYCEKCGSKNIYEKIFESTSQKKDQSVSIADYNGISTMVTLLYKPMTYEVGCKDCGNSKTLTK